MSDNTKVYEDKMKKSVESFETELSTIRVGRANPHVLDKITVNYFGVETPINQVGNVSVPEARMLVIQPWDAGLLKQIEKAIQASDLGINPTNDGKVIRLVFPELTQDRRNALAKEVKKKSEEFKVAVRNIRRDGMEALKKLEKKGDLTEDDLDEATDELQKLTDKYIVEIDKRFEVKNKEILSI